LRCPRCNQESVKFDPFMYLSLPLPTPKTKTFIITAVDVSGSSAPLVVAPEVPKTATIETLLQAVAALCGDPNAATEGVGERWLLAQWAPSAAAEKFQLFADGQVGNSFA